MPASQPLRVQVLQFGAQLRTRPTYEGPMSASRELQRQLKRLALCLPRPAKKPPAGPGWIYEIKHDGFRVLAERDARGVTLHSRKGYDFADRFPLAPGAIAKLPVRSCLIDGEAIVCDANGLAVFDLLRRRWHSDNCGRIAATRPMTQRAKERNRSAVGRKARGDGSDRIDGGGGNVVLNEQAFT